MNTNPKKRMEYEYQTEFSKSQPEMFNVDRRQKKAITMVKVIADYLGGEIQGLRVLDVGGSSGIIDEYLSRVFNEVLSVDIDFNAILYAKQNHNKNNLSFQIGDAMNLPYSNNSFDVVICSQVYEHVSNPKTMMDEIYRVLKHDGICYFSAGNKIMYMEPHHRLPLLSILPKALANLYLKASKKGTRYHENHLTVWDLKKLVDRFELIDYTTSVLNSPSKFGIAYMIPDKGVKHMLASVIAKHFYWLLPGYIWILKKTNEA